MMAVMGSNPVQARIFFSPVYNCDDQSEFHILLRIQIYDLSYIHLHGCYTSTLITNVTSLLRSRYLGRHAMFLPH